MSVCLKITQEFKWHVTSPLRNSVTGLLLLPSGPALPLFHSLGLFVWEQITTFLIHLKAEGPFQSTRSRLFSTLFATQILHYHKSKFHFWWPSWLELAKLLQVLFHPIFAENTSSGVEQHRVFSIYLVIYFYFKGQNCRRARSAPAPSSLLTVQNTC